MCSFCLSRRGNPDRITGAIQAETEKFGKVTEARHAFRVSALKTKRPNNLANRAFVVLAQKIVQFAVDPAERASALFD
jgi:hypothetical protein